MLQIISTAEFQEKIFDFTKQNEWNYSNSTPVVLNFSASWCGPCHRFAPTLEDAAIKYQDSIKVYKIDIDASPEVPAMFGVRSVPTTVFIRMGEEPALAMGAMTPESLDRAINELLLAPALQK